MNSKNLEQTLSYTVPHYKLIIVGNVGVGKTSIMNCLIGKAFDSAYQSTICVDTVSKVIMHNDKEIKIDIYDTAGQEKYFSIIQMYFKEVDIVFICFDVSDVSSFAALEKWLNVIGECCGGNIVKCVIGTKCDLEKKVSQSEINEFISRNNIQYFETSAKNNEGIEKVFYYSVAMLDVFNEEYELNKEEFVNELQNENKVTTEMVYDVKKKEEGDINVKGDSVKKKRKRKCICK